MMTLDEILALFPYKLKAGNGYLVECPLHDDQIGSLSIALKKNKKNNLDQIFFHCQAKCLGNAANPNRAAYRQLLSILGVTDDDLREKPAQTQNGSNGNGSSNKYAHLLEDIAAVYNYRDEAGSLLYQCVKYDTTAQKAKGRKPVKCRMRQPGIAPGYYKWNLDGVRLVLYRLKELLVSDQDDYVFIVEGEKDVEACRLRGLIATCNPTGAGSWTDDYSTFLANRIVIVLPDNDTPGEKHANEVYDSLLRCAPNVIAKILQLQGLKTKGDISDWFDAGHTVDELRKLADDLLTQTAQQQAPPAQPPPPIQPSQPPQAGQAKTYNTTDMGNAERFADKFGGVVRYCSKLGKDGVWLIWDGRRWQIDEKLKIHRMAKEVVPDIYLDSQNAGIQADKIRLFKWALQTEGLATRNNMVKDARPALAIAADELDTHPWLLNVKNGTIDLRTGKLSSHAQDHYLTKVLQINWDEKAQCPTWENFINSSQWDKQEMVDYLQKAVGYSLTGDVREKCMFILHGPKDTGKSTFVEAMQMLLGEYAIKIQTQTLMWRRERQQSNDIAILKGARFVHASEAEEHERLAEAQIKELTGGDTVTCRFLHAEFFQFQPEFKLWLSTNHKPKVSSDKATWGRLKLIPFTYQVPDDEKDTGLKAKLKTELPGILRWAVEGCLKWQVEGLAMPQIVIGATGKYQDEMDTIGQFLDECCDVGDDSYSVTSKALYAAYKQWCLDTGERVESQRGLGLKLNDKGLKNTRITRGVDKGRTEWEGVQIKP
jgi:putative DNA primase/helicase